MIKRVNRRKYNVKAFDIESHNDEESIAKRETSMWLGAYIDENSKIDDENSYIYSMDEFLERLQKEAKPKPNKDKKYPCKNILIYVFNLSFEWSFLLPVLLEKGYKFKENIDWKNDEYVYNSISTRSCSSVWTISLKMSKKSGRIIFRDLNKIFSGSLRDVAKNFGLETQKGEIDYRLNRLHGHVVTKEEKEYCFNDTKILMEILQKINDETFWKSISASSFSIKKGIKCAYPNKLKPFLEFRKDYPLLSREENDFIRKSVSGGICYAPTDYQFKKIKNKILHIDLHQAHPSSLALNYMPYGTGEYFKGKPPQKFGISCCHVKVSYSSVKLHSIIKLIGIPFIDGFELYVWNFEIKLMYECYNNLEIEYIDGYFYNAKPSPFAKYMRINYSKRLEAKKNKNLYDVMYYKLLNNSFYGKLIERPHNEIFENTILNDGIISSIIHEKKLEEQKVAGKYAYVPLGSCIPARTRVTLVSTALKFGWKNVLYFDTDSIFLLWNEEVEKVLKTINLKDELGGWGIEDMPSEAQFTAPKRYKLKVEGKNIIRMGGINFEIFMNRRNKELYGDDYDKYEKIEDIPFEEINITNANYEIKRAFRCKGGTIVDLQLKKISIQEKYKSVYNKNKDKK